MYAVAQPAKSLCVLEFTRARAPTLLSRDRYTCIVFHDKRPRRKDQIFFSLFFFFPSFASRSLSSFSFFFFFLLCLIVREGRRDSSAILFPRLATTLDETEVEGRHSVSFLRLRAKASFFRAVNQPRGTRPDYRSGLNGGLETLSRSRSEAATTG